MKIIELITDIGIYTVGNCSHNALFIIGRIYFYEEGVSSRYILEDENGKTRQTILVSRVISEIFEDEEDQ